MSLPIPTDLLESAPLTGKSPASALWVRKTPNLFRGVLELKCTSSTVEETEAIVRNAVTVEYSPGFVVPFAFGAILHYTDPTPSAAEVMRVIDDRASSKGTWQWVIVLNDLSKRAYGIHMWMPGYLTPVYEALLSHFESTGYACEKLTKQPSQFWHNLWGAMAALVKAHKVLVAAGVILSLALLVFRLFMGT
ncbi:hypothetical protein [Viridibacterium curvum]|uniref:Uncharacterized protein n=1 Tax=Viridibacterium curvum TaxID=1101404 RepID=A0ABP9QE87_9RHOO